jgi:16S rRNA (uracil1498-N3)-methyltransferase
LTAPIKRQEFLIEKVTELGVGHITPVLTDHTIIRQVNKERWHAWAVEASEQSEQLSVPLIHSPLPLFTLLGEWPADRPLLWCQERHPQACETISLLRGEGVDLSHPALLVGPEGGFSPQEKEFLSTRSFVHPFSLGTSVLRSETAAIVAVAALRFHLF